MMKIISTKSKIIAFFTLSTHLLAPSTLTRIDATRCEDIFERRVLGGFQEVHRQDVLVLSFAAKTDRSYLLYLKSIDARKNKSILGLIASFLTEDAFDACVYVKVPKSILALKQTNNDLSLAFQERGELPLKHDLFELILDAYGHLPASNVILRHFTTEQNLRVISFFNNIESDISIRMAPNPQFWDSEITFADFVNRRLPEIWHEAENIFLSKYLVKSLEDNVVQNGELSYPTIEFPCIIDESIKFIAEFSRKKGLDSLLTGVKKVVASWRTNT